VQKIDEESIEDRAGLTTRVASSGSNLSRYIRLAVRLGLGPGAVASLISRARPGRDKKEKVQKLLPVDPVARCL